MTTATHEALFVRATDPTAMFEKDASIARMADDDKNWPSQILSEIHQQLPFLSSHDVAINLTRIEPEAGFGFGYAIVRSKHPASLVTQPKSESNDIRIPIIVSDRHLQPFHVFSAAGVTQPLTQERVESILTDPALFAGAAKKPGRNPSLIDQLYPPYQQRQGFGRTSDASQAGISKNAEAEQPTLTSDRVRETGEYYEGLGQRGRNLGLGVGTAMGLGSLADIPKSVKWGLRAGAAVPVIGGLAINSMAGRSGRGYQRAADVYEGAPAMPDEELVLRA